MPIKGVNPEIVVYNKTLATETLATESVQHTPTKGASVKQKINKAVNYIFAKLNFLNQVKLEDSIASRMKQHVIYKKACRAGKLFSNADVLSFAEKLKNLKCHNEGYISPLPSSLGERNPSAVIKINLEDKDKDKDKIIAYPFVFPKKNRFSFDHIVLIAVDPKEHNIYYIDPQGLSSDDPSRLKCFDDKTDFDMRKDLEKLGRQLFDNGEYTIIENRECYQKDPYNCGAFVMVGLETLNNIRDDDREKIPEKLHRSFTVENIRQSVVDAFAKKAEISG